MFKTRSNCAKCIDIYEKGLRSEPEFIKSLKKLTSKEKSFVNNRIRDRRKIIHKKFRDIFRDEADTMLSVIENVANKKKMNKMKQQVHLRNEQQLMNKWEKTRLLQNRNKKTRAAIKIQNKFRKTRKSRKNKGKILSPKRQARANDYEDNMMAVLDTMDAGLSPEEIAFQEEMAGVAEAENILKATEYQPRLKDQVEKAGIKRVKDGYLITPQTQYRYSAPEKNTSDDFEPKPKPKKKGFFENFFGSPKKGGRRTRKKRKRKRTRKKRRRKTRK